MMNDLIVPEDQEKQNMIQTGVQHAHSHNPVVSYLASLGSKDSRRVQKTALDQIAGALSNRSIKDCMQFPWEQLDYGMVTAIEAWLDSKYAPATVNR